MKILLATLLVVLSVGSVAQASGCGNYVEYTIIKRLSYWQITGTFDCKDKYMACYFTAEDGNRYYLKQFTKHPQVEEGVVTVEVNRSEAMEYSDCDGEIYGIYETIVYKGGLFERFEEYGEPPRQ